MGNLAAYELENHAAAETTVVAFLLFKTDTAARYLSLIDPLHFRDAYRSSIVSTAMRHFRRDGVIVPELVIEETRETVGDEKVASYWREAAEVWSFSTLSSIAGFRVSLDRVRERAMTGASAELLRTVGRELDEGTINIDEARGRLAELTGGASVRHDTDETLATVLDHLDDDDEGQKIPTGIEWWDRLFHGGAMERGHVMVLAAPPGGGKSALALQVTLGVLSRDSSARGIWAMGEMTPKQLARRSIACVSGLPLGVLDRPDEYLSEHQLERKRSAWEVVRDIGRRLRFVHSPLTPSTIEDAVARNGAGWLVLDYLQLVRPARAASTRRDEVDQVVRELARITKQHDVAAFVISNMPKGDGSRRDIFSAFKESSEIEYAADIAWVGEQAGDIDDGEFEDIEITWRMLKNRHGPIRSVRTLFQAPSQRFVEILPGV